ncbi:MAG: hypothetical protein ABFD89_16830 [Bryobacteraceae bacterium]
MSADKLAHTRHTKGEPIRLGFGGELQPVADQVIVTRNRFFSAIEEHAPIALETLASNVLPVYLDARAAWSREYPDREDPLFPISDELYKSIASWARQYYLTFHNEVPRWVLLQAQITLWQWSHRPELVPKSFGLLAPSSFFRKPKTAKGRIDFEWNVIRETRAEAETRIVATLRALLGEILKCETDRLLDILDKGASKVFREIDTMRGEQHFEWAVRYQIIGQDVSEIAYSKGHKRTVNAGLKAVLDLVGLTRRPHSSDAILGN